VYIFVVGDEAAVKVECGGPQ